MRRLLAFLLLPFVLSAQAAPPPTDLTAIYVNDRGRETMRIEVAADGDLRISDSVDRYWLWHDGQAYLVVSGPGGPIVERVADIAAARAEAGQPGPAARTLPGIEMVESGRTVVNGRTGTIYAARGVKVTDQVTQPVLSDDPALAPIARAFARQGELMRIMPGPEGDSGIDMSGFFAKGALLRLGDATLQSVDPAPIPAARFAVPAAPKPSALVRDEWRDRFRSDDDEAAFAEANRRIDQTTFKRAVFASGKLWLLSDLGYLVTIDPAQKTSAKVAVPETPIELCRGVAGPVVMTGVDKGDSWTLRRRVGGDWQGIGTIANGGEPLIAMDCSGDRVSVLTARRLIQVGPGGQKAIALSQPFDRVGVMATMHDTGDAMLVGLDAGEWGGGLRRIDRATGRVTLIENKASGDKWCKKPLDAACDPVNGIAAMPGKPDCFVLAIGLVHMSPQGRLLSLCGSKVAMIYYKPYTIERWAGYDPNVQPPFETVPFFGLTRTPDALWAVGTDGLYRMGDGGMVTFSKMPDFETIDGISVSFALPDLILVRTTINQRVSLSGAVPMLVPRQ